jgi:hypothetical protein
MSIIPTEQYNVMVNSEELIVPQNIWRTGRGVPQTDVTKKTLHVHIKRLYKITDGSFSPTSLANFEHKHITYLKPELQRRIRNLLQSTCL